MHKDKDGNIMKGGPKGDKDMLNKDWEFEMYMTKGKKLGYMKGKDGYWYDGKGGKWNYPPWHIAFGGLGKDKDMMMHKDMMYYKGKDSSMTMGKGP